MYYFTKPVALLQRYVLRIQYLTVLGLFSFLMGCSSAPPPIAEDLTSNWQPETVPAQVYLIPNGKEALTHRIAAVRNAKSYVLLEYFTWDHDLSGAYLYRELRMAADRGVKVKLVLDDLLEFNDMWLRTLAAHQNIEIRIFNPFGARQLGWFSRMFDFQIHKNKRNHRLHEKLLLVDGDLMITGGRNIGDSYFEYSKKANFFDLDLLVKGDVLAAFEKNFNQLFLSESAVDVQTLVGTPRAEERDYFLVGFTKLANKYPLQLAAIANSVLAIAEPEYTSVEATALFDSLNKLEDKQPYHRERLSKTMQQKHKQIEQLVISTPYLLPKAVGESDIQRFKQAGAEVTAITAGKTGSDSAFVGAYYSPYRKQLLQQDVKLYEFAPDKEKGRAKHYYHVKALVVNKQCSYVGSSNFDPRSDHLNLEFGLYLCGEGFAEQLEDYLFQDRDTHLWQLGLNDKGETIWQKGKQQRIKASGSKISDAIYRSLGLVYDL
ncbi:MULTISPECIES: phospholipase D-like domain-containing protein [unclassified Agarivorans]|uniref:phospholipase D-like domain-containing protein n=1 Tax=unclassified Agarivorans TaxID=2636026 RepID=UPI0026E37EB0|nr:MULTISPECIES: phospholipase D family protein [unclassified Agarivorans]MDO6686046.1 phospholipase D family protein [Agarivorans sp. 3_MG-2023]MDO6713816.1 phospholipase D family protein [Agarivorans sp. 2_MG-2023]